MSDSKSKELGEVLTRESTRTKEPKMYRVLLLNDHYTSQQFVVEILEQVFHKAHPEAVEIILQVHTKGSGTAGIYTKEIAETKVATVHHLAVEHEFPLKCSMEPM